MTKQNKSTAKVVDGKLILSLLGAHKPILWQMDLGDAKASALEVSEKNKSHILVLRTAKGENLDIAVFETQGSAVQALKAASKAMESAQGQIKPANNHSDDNRAAACGSKKTPLIIKLVMGVFMLAGFVFLGSLALAFLSSAPMQQRAMQTTSTPQAAQSQIGIPMSADDFLRAR